ncbi:uncharacterized protein LOC141724726 [Apium graveolens]|uniref:uncharacterized protein LOC141661972 n=1 Tax=Apium graveolens TaxID=4045 RepID=UPI003D79F11F
MSSNPVKDAGAPSGSNANKASLLKMEFSLDEVNYAIDILGEDAAVDELVDFIAATHIAEETEKDGVCTNHCHEEKNEVGNASDVLSGSLIAKKEILVEMNFSLDEINLAMEMLGNNVLCCDALLEILLVVFKYPCRHLGENTPVEKLVNYIIDFVRAEESEQDGVCSDHCNGESTEFSYVYTIIPYPFDIFFYYNFENIY